jgi:hypothetical protein
MPKAISKKQVGTARTSLTPQPEALVSEGSEYRAGQAGGATTAAEGTAAYCPLLTSRASVMGFRLARPSYFWRIWKGSKPQFRGQSMVNPTQKTCPRLDSKSGTVESLKAAARCR